MRVIVAGATGAVGRPLVQALLSAGYEVVGFGRSTEKLRQIQDDGAVGVAVDMLDAAAVRDAVRAAHADIVINELTALPSTYSAEAMKEAAAVDHRLRREGGANLETAAQEAGVRRYILQSTGFFYAPGSGLATETDKLAVDAPAPRVAGGARLYAELEARAVAYDDWDAVLLRYGFFCGPGTWFTYDGDIAGVVRRGKYPISAGGAGVWSFVHVDDAAAATVAALSARPGAYNIVDDNPSPVNVWLPAFARWTGAAEPPAASEADTLAQGGPDALYYATRLRGASNAKARRELGFRPRRLEWL